MTATASIKFTQGANTDVAGRAVVGTLASVDGPVTVTNGDNTNVVSWEIILLDAPPNSASFPPGSNPQVLGSAISSTPSATFSPDAEGGTYRVLLDVVDSSGNRNRDIRCFGVPDSRGVIAPPYQKNPDPLPVSLPGILTPISDPQIKEDEQNYGGQGRGWAGDLSSGQLSTFFQNYKDSKLSVASSTPFNPSATEADVILVNTTTIGAASVVNLHADTRVGQYWVVQDRQYDAFDFPVTINLPGGSAFSDGSTSKTIFADGGLIVVQRVSAALWIVVLDTNRREYFPIFSSVASTSNTSGFDRLSSFSLDGSSFPPGTRFVLEAIMETTDAAHSHTVQLFNQTTAAVVSTPLSSSSLTPEEQTDTLSALTDILAGDNLYELQHQMDSGSSPEQVTCSGAHFRVVYATTG